MAGRARPAAGRVGGLTAAADRLRDPLTRGGTINTDAVQLLLLRHAHVEGHRGDVPITEEGQRQSRHAGAWIAERGHDVAAVLYGGTRRTRETADGVVVGLGDPDGVPVSDCFALRNPDLYLGGERVSMVSSAQAFADQTSSVTAEDVERIPFFHEWLTHPERVGFWVAHKSPPGDDAASVERRIAAFAASLYDVPRWRGHTIVAITHSPVLRAVGLGLRGTDPGEPPYVTGYAFTATAEALHVDDVAPTTA